MRRHLQYRGAKTISMLVGVFFSVGTRSRTMLGFDSASIEESRAICRFRQVLECALGVCG
jgi:hypothetical protein